VVRYYYMYVLFRYVDRSPWLWAFSANIADSFTGDSCFPFTCGYPCAPAFRLLTVADYYHCLIFRVVVFSISCQYCIATWVVVVKIAFLIGLVVIAI
jgi:hypothetical protein